MPKEVWRTGSDGLLECVDSDTGEVLYKQTTKDEIKPGSLRKGGTGRGRRSKDGLTHHVVLDGRGRKLVVPIGTNPDDLPRCIYPYSQITCDHILAKVSEGATLTEIGLMDGFPPASIIGKWVREHPEFKAQMKLARAARAEYYADQVIEVAKKVKEGTAKSSRVKMDAYTWAAEMNDRQTYGKQTKVVGDPDQPLSILVETGIHRDEPASIPTTSKPVEEIE
jgi:hypothetical protein